MTCLVASLKTLDHKHVLWYSPDGDLVASVPVRAGHLQATLAQIRLGDWRGKRVAIGKMPVLELLATLVLLDGLAAAILILPNEEEDDAAREARLAQAGIECVLAGEGLGLARRLADAGTGDGASTLASAHMGTQMTTSEPATQTTATTWLMPTSGTTGSPKLIPHSFASLTKSMVQARPGKTFTWGCLYSVRRFAGLQVFLQAWLARTPLILAEDGVDLSHTLARLIARNCNALSATPSMWRKLAMTPDFARLPLRQITLGGEIVDQAVLDMLAHSFPAARITHIYASTEAGVGFAVNDGRAGFPLAFLHAVPNNVRMRIDADQHLWFAAARGSLTLAGADPDADGWLDSGDIVQVLGERVLFLGRANGSINVGGNKVMPEEVESVIKELSVVAFVHVRARNSGMVGSLVEAAVKLKPGNLLDTAFKKHLTSHCRARLDAFKVPAFIVELPAIELTASGKVSRLPKVIPS
jgi:acyl-CoA synthetase (AMP-forming)/AMP-acid ligase II